MTPGFLCWLKPFQIKACVGLIYLFSKEKSLSMTLSLFMENLLYIILAAGDRVDKAKSFMELVTLGARKSD